VKLIDGAGLVASESKSPYVVPFHIDPEPSPRVLRKRLGLKT
jgi:hypothetical protein